MNAHSQEGHSDLYHQNVISLLLSPNEHFCQREADNMTRTQCIMFYSPVINIQTWDISYTVKKNLIIQAEVVGVHEISKM